MSDIDRLYRQHDINTQIMWLEHKADTKLNNFQRDIIEKLNDGDRIYLLSPPRRIGKTYIARLLLECCPEVTIFLPHERNREHYPTEFSDRIEIFNPSIEHNFMGRMFDKVIFDECPHGSEADLSLITANKIIAFVDNDWWDYRPGFNSASRYELYRDLWIRDETEEDKIGDWDK